MNKNLVYLIGVLILAFILYNIVAMGYFAQPNTYNQSGLSFQYPNNWVVVSNGSSSNG